MKKDRDEKMNRSRKDDTHNELIKEIQKDIAQKRKRKRAVSAIFFLAILISVFLNQKGYVASGNDAWGHLFKSNLLYENIGEGNLYPLYTKLWYNGMQPFRYWAPIPYYVLALLQWVAGGSIEGAYVLFAGVSFFIGAYAWILFGEATNRIFLGTILGILWFFLPENIRVFFCEGNVPRMVTAMLIPYLVYAIWLFYVKKSDRARYGILFCLLGITLSHVMIAAMVGIATFLFLLFDVMANKEYKRAIQTLCTMLVSFLVGGIWLLPALSQGLVGMDPEASEAVMKSLTYALQESLNPWNRINGITDTFYYGISIVVIASIGILVGKKKKKAGFVVTILVLVLTIPEVVPILTKLPFSQLFWMMRFATIAYAFFFWALLEWTSIRKYFCAILTILLVIDCIPSLMIERYYTQVSAKAEEELTLAQEITTQRLAILDLSSYGSYPSWKLCVGKNPVSYTYGWAWQGASTASNIVMLNTAVEYGRFAYVFDRCLELGNDTILLPKSQVVRSGTSEGKLMRAAGKSKYMLIRKTEEAYIFHRDLAEQFGVSTQYTGLTIGQNAKLLTLAYPSFREGDCSVLDEYTLEELQEYKVVYLSGFTYEDKAHAEELLRKAAEAGIRIIIDVTNLREDPITKRASILGVTAQSVNFQDCYPDLQYKEEEHEMEYFDVAYSTWNCTYIEGLKKVTGSTIFMDNLLPFAGTGEEENIIFVGFNLYYHALLTQDKEAFQIMNDILESKEDSLPERHIVPLEVNYSKHKITIATVPTQNSSQLTMNETKSDDKEEKIAINTTLANQDLFTSKQKIESQNNLLIIQEDQVEINLTYPYWKEGTCITIVGVLLYVALGYWVKNKKTNE